MYDVWDVENSMFNHNTMDGFVMVISPPINHLIRKNVQSLFECHFFYNEKIESEKEK